jgi:hypothetical protein
VRATYAKPACGPSERRRVQLSCANRGRGPPVSGAP